MANLQTRIIGIIDSHMREWVNTARGAGYSVPPMTSPWLAELAEEIVAAVDSGPVPEVTAGRDISQTAIRAYGPSSGRVPAGTLRRPDTTAQRQPGEDLGTEALPQ